MTEYSDLDGTNPLVSEPFYGSRTALSSEEDTWVLIFAGHPLNLYQSAPAEKNPGTVELVRFRTCQQVSGGRNSVYEFGELLRSANKECAHAWPEGQRVWVAKIRLGLSPPSALSATLGD